MQRISGIRVLLSVALSSFPVVQSVPPTVAEGKTTPQANVERQVVAAANAVPPAPSGTAPYITGDPPRGPVKPFVIDMVARLQPDTGPGLPPIIFHDVLVNMRWQGHKATRRTTATTRPGETEFYMWATVIFDAKTFMPYYSEYRRRDGVFVRHQFNGLHVTETRTIKELKSPAVGAGEKLGTVTSEFDLPEPAFTWIENTGLPILLSLPLRQGFSGSVPVISGERDTLANNKPCTVGPCYVRRMTYHVIGAEDVKGISRVPVHSWKVSVPDTGFTFWIACKNPRLIQVNWPGPKHNGTFSMGPREEPPLGSYSDGKRP